MQTQGAFVAVRELLDNYSAGLGTGLIISVRGAFLSREVDGRTVDKIEHESVATYIRERLHWNEEKIKEVTVTSLYLNMVMDCFGRDLPTAMDHVRKETRVGMECGRCGMLVLWLTWHLGFAGWMLIVFALSTICNL
jgi:hypothetical protein